MRPLSSILYRQSVRSGSLEGGSVESNVFQSILSVDRATRVFASRHVSKESIRGRYAMNEKAGPEDFLYTGTFSEPKMPRFLFRSSRFVACALILLWGVTGILA